MRSVRKKKQLDKKHLKRKQKTVTETDSHGNETISIYIPTETKESSSAKPVQLNTYGKEVIPPHLRHFMTENQETNIIKGVIEEQIPETSSVPTLEQQQQPIPPFVPQQASLNLQPPIASIPQQSSFVRQGVIPQQTSVMQHPGIVQQSIITQTPLNVQPGLTQQVGNIPQTYQTYPVSTPQPSTSFTLDQNLMNLLTQTLQQQQASKQTVKPTAGIHKKRLKEFSAPVPEEDQDRTCFYCKRCSCHYSRKDELTFHEKYNCLVVDAAFICDICEKGYVTKTGVKNIIMLII